MTSPNHRQRLVYILVGLIVGAIASSMAWAANGGSADVRLAARVLEDGRVEVALQQADDRGDSTDGSWSELQRPEARFLAADAERGRWHYSTPLSLAFAHSDADEPETTEQAELEEPAAASITTEIGPFEIVGTPTGNRPFTDETLFCVVTHGVPADFFWFQVYSAFADAQAWNDINLRTEMRETGAEQAMAIDECVADGAAAIATTLADVDALAGSLQRATEAGVRLATFNSGSDRATGVGSSVHVALDEIAVGRAAAAESDRHGGSGDLLCILHEPTNRGLEQRCDSLEANYDDGAVVRLRMSESPGTAQEAIAAAMTEDVGGVLALNANTAYDLVAAVSVDYPDVALAAVSADFPQPLALLHQEQLSFVLWSRALEQGYHIITALLFAHGSPFPPAIGLFDEAAQITIQPSVITAESVRRLLAEDNMFRSNLPAWIDALERAIDGGAAEAEEPGDSLPADEAESGPEDPTGPESDDVGDEE